MKVLKAWAGLALLIAGCVLFGLTLGTTIGACRGAAVVTERWLTGDRNR